MRKWRPVVGYEGLYEVSDAGEVRSLRGGVTMAPQTDGWGYQRVALSRERQKVSHSIHVLVLAAFVGPRPERSVTRHLDGDPANNDRANLTYGSQSENMRDRLRHGTDPNHARTHCKHGHPFDDANTYIEPGGHRNCRACNRRNKAQSRAIAEVHP